MKKEKLRKILAIRDYNLKKEDEFPKNPNNITKDELHDHFDLDDDGKVTLDEYADHINFHCDNPEILDDELQQADFERGFKYAKGGIVWKKNIGDDGWSSTMENESAYDNVGGYISESGNWKIYRNGRFYEREDGYKNFKRDGDWIVENKGEFKGEFESLKIAKRIAEQWENKIPKEYAKGGKTKKAKTWKEKYNKKYGNELDASNSLSDIAEDTGVSKKGIQQIYNKGIGAYKTNPSSVRPNVKSKEQWAQARVYSAVMGGKASKVDKKELSMEKGGIMDSRRNKDIEFDRAQEREYMRSQYDRMTQDDKEKLKMIQQMMAKEKVNYAKGGLTKAELKLNIYEPSGDYFMEKKGGKIILHLTSKDASNLPPSFFESYNVEDNGKGYYGTSYIVSKKYAKGGEVKKSEKYGSEYKKEDGQLLFRPINTKEEWSEVSDDAFNKEERKDFDTEMSKIFKKGGKTDTKISNLVTVGAIEKPLKDLEKIGKLKLEYLYNQLKISKNLLDNSIGKDDRIMNSVRYDSIQKLIDNILIK